MKYRASTSEYEYWASAQSEKARPDSPLVRFILALGRAFFFQPADTPVSAPAHSAFSRAMQQGLSDQQERFREITFTFSMIALSAKLAAVDGDVNYQEYLAFRGVFPIEENENEKIRKLFMSACEDTLPYHYYARQVRWLYQRNGVLLHRVVEQLCSIASADKVIGKSEAEYIQNVAGIFGISRRVFDRLMRGHKLAVSHNPYALLGVRPRASDEEVKMAYRRLMREFHPDGLEAAGASHEVVVLAGRKVAAINEAYDKISRVRGLKKAA